MHNYALINNKTEIIKLYTFTISKNEEWVRLIKNVKIIQCSGEHAYMVYGNIFQASQQYICKRKYSVQRHTHRRQNKTRRLSFDEFD